MAEDAIGHRRWAIAEGYIPGWRHAAGPELESHETVCILNASGEDAHVRITIFYEDRDPSGPYELTVPAGRTRHLRLNELEDPEPIQHGTPYSSLIESDTPVVVQHTRLDSRTGVSSLLSTMAFPG